MIIDKKGRIFGKVNVIDFLVLVFILCLMPMFYFGFRIMSKSQEAQEVLMDYTITRFCPICGQPIKVKVKLGEKPERYYELVCPSCRNRVRIRTTSEYKWR